MTRMVSKKRNWLRFLRFSHLFKKVSQPDNYNIKVSYRIVIPQSWGIEMEIERERIFNEWMEKVHKYVLKSKGLKRKNKFQCRITKPILKKRKE